MTSLGGGWTTFLQRVPKIIRKQDFYITIHINSKITVMKEHQNNFMVDGLGSPQHEEVYYGSQIWKVETNWTSEYKVYINLALRSSAWEGNRWKDGKKTLLSTYCILIYIPLVFLIAFKEVQSFLSHLVSFPCANHNSQAPWDHPSSPSLLRGLSIDSIMW